MPILHDVAKLAGVAPITVSRVINNSGYRRALLEAGIGYAAPTLFTMGLSIRLAATR